MTLAERAVIAKKLRKAAFRWMRSGATELGMELLERAHELMGLPS